jgi:ankyrin repeat protein
MSTIFDAIREKDLDRLVSLVDAGASLTDYSEDGLTPLAAASSVGFSRGIRFLLGLSEVEPNKGTPDGTSPLMIAAKKDRETSLHIMLEFPYIDVNHANSDGDTALLYAIKERAHKSFEILVKHPCIDVNKRNKSDMTPLLLAAQKNEPIFVEALLNKGADANYLKVGDKTIFEMAAEGSFDHIINRMIINKVKHGISYNTSVRNTAVTPLATLESLTIDIYPQTENALEFLGKKTIDAPYPVKVHSIAESVANRPIFLRSLDLVRGMCIGLDVNYASRKLPRVDLYITVSFGTSHRLAGFLYGQLFPEDKDFNIELICTRNTVKGGGVFLMNLVKTLSSSARYTMITLDSVYSAVDFYESQGFMKDEASVEDLAHELQPMFFLLPLSSTKRTPASKKPAGAGAGAGAGAATRGRGGARRRKARKTRRNK